MVQLNPLVIFLKGKPYPFRVDSASLKLMGVLPLTSVTVGLQRDQGRADRSTQYISSIAGCQPRVTKGVFFLCFGEKFTL